MILARELSKLIKAKLHGLQQFILKKDHIPSFWKAQQHLFYLMLGGNILKGFVKLIIAIDSHQSGDIYRALFFIISSGLLILLIKKFPSYIKVGIHFALLSTIFHIYHRVFTPSIGADILALQYVFMAIICSFYGLNKKWGTLYTKLRIEVD